MIAIIGKGGFAREVDQMLYKGHCSIMYEFEEIKSIPPGFRCLIAIGNPQARKRIVEENPLLEYYSDGLIKCEGAIVTTNVTIGKHVHLNLHVTVGHDCILGDYFTAAPGARISGNVTIGECVYVGSNAVIIEKLTICDNVTIGAGAVVTKDITEPGTYVGIPAKKI